MTKKLSRFDRWFLGGINMLHPNTVYFDIGNLDYTKSVMVFQIGGKEVYREIIDENGFTKEGPLMKREFGDDYDEEN